MIDESLDEDITSIDIVSLYMLLSSVHDMFASQGSGLAKLSRLLASISPSRCLQLT